MAESSGPTYLHPKSLVYTDILAICTDELGHKAIPNSKGDTIYKARNLHALLLYVTL